MNTIYKSIILTTGLFLTLTISASAAPGDLDLSFGSGGFAVTSITNEIVLFDQPKAMLVQPDGKIIVSGLVIYNDEEIGYPHASFLARYHPTGMLDDSFGTNGKIVVPYNPGFVSFGEDIALQPDGKIVAIGRGWTANIPSFALSRFNSDGGLDTTFGTGGKVVTPIEDNTALASKVTVQPDGKIVAAGYVYLGDPDWGFAIVRYHPNGSLDTSFGTGGKIITPLGSSSIGIGKVLLQPDGKIIIVGNAERLFMLVGYNTDGSLDTGFGAGGKVQHSIFGTANLYDGILQPDGKIVAVGSSNGRDTIIRCNANGSLDMSFASNGIFITENYGYYKYGIALQTDGKILVFSGTDGQVSVLRLKKEGLPDSGFGVNGRVITPIGTANASWAVDGAVQSDGKILALAQTFAPDDIAVIRYLGDSAISPPTVFDFDGDRRADISVFRPTERVWYLDQSTNGFSVAQFGLSTDKITPADYDGDGKTDISVYRDGIWYWLNSSNGTFNASQFGIAGDMLVPADYTGDGRAELAVYRAGVWWVMNLADNQTNTIQFGIASDKPVVADYDGDSRVDQAVYRDGTWHINRSTQGYTVVQFGLSTDKPVTGDYDGDGKSDQAVYRDGTWHIWGSTTGYSSFQFGIASDTPAPADYDGDGRTDAAVYRDGVWYLLQSTNGISIQRFGLANDKPVPSAYLP